MQFCYKQATFCFFFYFKFIGYVFEFIVQAQILYMFLQAKLLVLKDPRRKFVLYW